MVGRNTGTKSKMGCRMDDAYERYRAAQMEDGCAYQDFACDLLLRSAGLVISINSSARYQMRVGESRQGFEIKHDKKFARTGNLWIEVAEKARPRPGDYAPSGIWRNDNTWQYL